MTLFSILFCPVTTYESLPRYITRLDIGSLFSREIWKSNVERSDEFTYLPIFSNMTLLSVSILIFLQS